MTGGRPRTAIGTYGTISIRQRGGRFVAETRFRDLDGRLRKVNATASSRSVARASLKERLLVRPGHGSGGLLSLASPFRDLVELWLADLEVRDLTEGTRENYRDDLRLHITPVFGTYTLGEITTGRVEWFLRREAAVSYSRAKHSRTAAGQGPGPVRISSTPSHSPARETGARGTMDFDGLRYARWLADEAGAGGLAGPAAEGADTASAGIYTERVAYIRSFGGDHERRHRQKDPRPGEAGVRGAHEQGSHRPGPARCSPATPATGRHRRPCCSPGRC